MKKISLLLFSVIALQTTVKAEHFGAGFATGALTGVALSKITESPRYYDPVAEEEARNMRSERRAEERARREEKRIEREEQQAEAKRIKAIEKEIKQLKKDIKLETKKLDKEKDPKKIDHYSVSIKKMEDQLADLQDEMDDDSVRPLSRSR